MPTLLGAICSRLRDDPDFASMLATYLGEPAVFTREPVPPDATPPYVVVGPELSEVPEDCISGERHAEILLDIRLYWPEAGSTVPVEQALRVAYDLLHRRPLTWDGWIARRVICSTEQIAAQDDLYPRLLSVRIAASKA